MASTHRQVETRWEKSEEQLEIWAQSWHHDRAFLLPPRCLKHLSCMPQNTATPHGGFHVCTFPASHGPCIHVCTCVHVVHMCYIVYIVVHCDRYHVWAILHTTFAVINAPSCISNSYQYPFFCPFLIRTGICRGKVMCLVFYSHSLQCFQHA